MKVTINIDCTPAEARAFLGLPDLAPLHAAWLARMQGFIADGMTPADIEKLMRSWMPAGMEGMEALQKLFWSAATGGQPGGSAKS